MSTDFRPRDHVLASELFDGRLKKFGCREHGKAGVFSRCLVDGSGNYLASALLWKKQVRASWANE